MNEWMNEWTQFAVYSLTQSTEFPILQTVADPNTCQEIPAKCN